MKKPQHQATVETADVEEEQFDHDLDEFRCYEQEFPEAEELVMAEVTRIDEDTGVFVKLLEYGGMEAFMPIPELSKRRPTSIKRIVREGKVFPVVTLRVDDEQGYVDVSKKRVRLEDTAAIQGQFASQRRIRSILITVAQKHSLTLEYLYNEVVWPLTRKFNDPSAAFFSIVMDPACSVLDGLRLSDEAKDTLVATVTRRMRLAPLKIQTLLEVTCFAPAGVDAIRAALMAGQEQGTHEAPIKISLVGPPLYVLDTVTRDRSAAVAVHNSAIQEITRVIESMQGEVVVKFPPSTVGEREQSELDAMMLKLASDNQEIDGDAPEEEAAG